MKVWIQSDQGKYYLSHEPHLGLEYLTKEKQYATNYSRMLTLDEVYSHIKYGFSGITPLVIGSEE